MLDPYESWLRIAPGRRPPTHYQLLGIEPREANPQAIRAAIVSRSASVRRQQTGRYSDEATRVLNEIATAGVCLLDATKRAAYDASLLAPSSMVSGRADLSESTALNQSVSAAPLSMIAQRATDPVLEQAAAAVRSAPTLPRLATVRRRRFPTAWASVGIAAAVVILVGVLAIVLTRGDKGDSSAIAESADSPGVRGSSTPVVAALGEPMQPPATIIEDSIGVKLALMPAGEFLMGPAELPESQQDNRPALPVRFDGGCYLGLHEITVGQFRRFIDDTRHTTDAQRAGQGGFALNPSTGYFDGPNAGYHWRHTGYAQDDEHPVTNVSWNDAVAFCDWLSRREGATYRLPTESEWEYACRGGGDTRFATGDDEATLEGAANVADAAFLAEHDSRTWAKAWNDGFAYTAPVGRFRPNAFGLYDMHGNVSEWCQDDAVGGSATTLAESNERAVRGGSFAGGPLSARFHSANAPHFCSCLVGFRVLRESR